MRAIYLGQNLVVAVTMSLMLLISSVIGLGVGIRHGNVVPPELDVRIAHMRLAAYVSQNPDCPPHIQCPLRAVASAQAYVLVWSLDELATAGQPYGRTTHRLLVVPLKR